MNPPRPRGTATPLGVGVEGFLAAKKNPSVSPRGLPPPHRKSMGRSYLTENASRYSAFTAFSSAAVTGSVNS